MVRLGSRNGCEWIRGLNRSMVYSGLPRGGWPERAVLYWGCRHCYLPRIQLLHCGTGCEESAFSGSLGLAYPALIACLGSQTLRASHCFLCSAVLRECAWAEGGGWTMGQVSC